ncbi:acyltransferase [Candidatus Saccharibacteria bacterium]|nr:acyltransferase [Candidatus Saccharibacteria bacterium]
MPWLIGVNSLRFFAIVLILLYHFFRNFLPGGFLAVDIFFTLSSFLLTTSLIRDYSRYHRLRYFRFLGKRLARLWLPLLFCVVVVLACAFVLPRDILVNTPLNALYALTFSTNIAELITGGSYENTISPNLFEHTWFLALEFQFILFAPFLIAGFLKIAPNYRHGLKGLAICSALLALLSVFLASLHGGLFREPDRAYFALDTHFAPFVVGISFAALNALRPRTPRTQKFLPTLGLVIAVVTITLFALKTSYQNPLTFALALPAVSVSTACALFCIIRLQPNRLVRARIPRMVKFFDTLGNLSFGLYLFHWPLYLLLPHFLALFPDLQRSSAAFVFWLIPLLAFIVSLVLAVVLARTFANPKFFASFHKRPLAYRFAFVAICAILIVPAVLTIVTTPKTSSISAQLNSSKISHDSRTKRTASHDTDYLGAKAFLKVTDTVFATEFNKLANTPPTQSSGYRAADSPNSADVLIIGDSVTLGAKAELESTIENAYVDAAESRGIEVATKLLAGYSATGKLPKIIIVSLATNERTITDALLQDIVSVAGAGRQLIFVTAYAGPMQPRDSQNNALKSFADTHSNVVVADWWQVAHDNWSLMYDDHIHLNPDGRRTYANLLNNLVRSLR